MLFLAHCCLLLIVLVLDECFCIFSIAFGSSLLLVLVCVACSGVWEVFPFGVHDIHFGFKTLS